MHHPRPLTDDEVLAASRASAEPWTAAVRDRRIDSRRLVTDRAILDAVTARAPRTALDLGCGEGWLTRALAERGVRAMGVDAVPALVDAARAASPGLDFRLLGYEEIAAGALDVRVDAVVANFALIGGPAVDALVGAAPALLTDRGAFVVQTLHPLVATGDQPYADGWRPGSWAGFGPEFTHPAPWYFRTLESWVRLLAAAGLRLADLREPVHPATGRPASVILVATRA